MKRIVTTAMLIGALSITSPAYRTHQAPQDAPESEAAWSYKTNWLLEMAKFAEMGHQLDQKKNYVKQSEEAERRTNELSAKRMKQAP